MYASTGHLNMLNDKENIWIIIYLVCQLLNAQIIRKMRSGLTEIILKHETECLDHFLILTRVSKINSKDMLDCFINIYVPSSIFNYTHMNLINLCMIMNSLTLHLVMLCDTPYQMAEKSRAPNGQ